ncbi:hypothetical protein LCGC14_1415300 [marine sediment metagenome]|uniref:Uncharacterized protein n=1 Tax=marine sediment metagenome TaxID=412755 RepID=A0A0F9MUR7_9ZZZZ
MNAYMMMLEVRDNIGEETPKKWDDAAIQRKLNGAQRRLAMLLSMSPGDWLVKSADLTPSNSLITLPTDCMKPVYLEITGNKQPIPIRTNVRDRSIGRLPASGLGVWEYEAYLLKDYIEVNVDSFSTGVTLWYQQRVPDLALGVVATGSASTLVLQVANEPNGNDDYYNGVTIEVIDTNFNINIVSTVSDYDGGTFTITLTGTPTTSDFYGTIPELPEECHDLMVLMATTKLLASPGAALDPESFQFFVNEKNSLLKDFKDWVSTRKSGSSHTRVTELIG